MVKRKRIESQASLFPEEFPPKIFVFVEQFVQHGSIDKFFLMPPEQLLQEHLQARNRTPDQMICGLLRMAYVFSG